MNLANILLENKSAILKQWFAVILETYPPDTTKFLEKQKNQFANPVGATILQGLEEIYNEIISTEMDTEKVSSFLDNIIRIRAVQDFTPAKAVSFIFDLKKIIQKIDGVSRTFPVSEELQKIEARIDTLALLSFDIFMKCREKLYDIRANEVKSRTFRLLQQANLICELKDDETDSKENNFVDIKRKEATQ